MDKMYYTNSDIFLLYFPFNTLVKIQPSKDTFVPSMMISILQRWTTNKVGMYP